MEYTISQGIKQAPLRQSSVRMTFKQFWLYSLNNVEVEQRKLFWNTILEYAGRGDAGLLVREVFPSESDTQKLFKFHQKFIPEVEVPLDQHFFMPPPIVEEENGPSVMSEFGGVDNEKGNGDESFSTESRKGKRSRQEQDNDDFLKYLSLLQRCSTVDESLALLHWSMQRRGRSASSGIPELKGPNNDDPSIPFDTSVVKNVRDIFTGRNKAKYLSDIPTKYNTPVDPNEASGEEEDSDYDSDEDIEKAISQPRFFHHSYVRKPIRSRRPSK
ncbi:unnamed protein product [Ectocarpus sp. 8 AP-2014]